MLGSVGTTVAILGVASIGFMMLQGRIDADKAQAALKGWKYADSPRGPIMIDAATRDIVMNEYLSELVKVGGRLVQKNIGVIPAVKDMCKELKEGKCAQ